MRQLTALLLVGTALFIPSVAFGKDITVSIDLTRYSGPEAYLAVYVTNPDGSYHSTLWVAGTKTKYLRALRQRMQGIAASGTVNIDGITGASVGGGRNLTISASLADALFDAGYEIRVDTAVEHGGEFSSDAVAPLVSTGAQVDGIGYVDTMTVGL